MLESVTQLPFNRQVGIQKATVPDALLELPAGNQFLNHVGTVHAAAQLALAEACAGEYLLQRLASNSNVIPLVRRVDAKFRKPAHGRITAQANPALTNLDESLVELARKGRCITTIHVDLRDENGEHCLAASFDWFLSTSSA